MILIDVEALQNNDYKDRGIGRYVKEFLKELSKRNIDFSVIYNHALPLPDLSFLTPGVTFFSAQLLNVVDISPKWVIFLSPFEKTLGRTEFFIRKIFPDIQIAFLVHDLIPLIYEDTYLNGAWDRLNYNKSVSMIEEADLIFTVSENTAYCVHKYLNVSCPVVAIGAGVSDIFYQESSEVDGDAIWEDLKNKYPEMSRDFLFTLSGGHKSKNLIGLLEIYADLPFMYRMTHPLFIGGGFNSESMDWFKREWIRILKEKNLEYTKINFIRKETDESIKKIYEKCSLFVFPSLYEGYGLPLPEAIVSGAVCVSSNSSSLSEILNNSLFTCDVNDKKHFSHLIVKLSTNKGLRREFFEWANKNKYRFRWCVVVDKFLKAITLSKEKSGSVVKTKEKISIVGTLPPQESGIASYNGKILPSLMRRRGVDWYVSGGKIPILSKFSVFPLKMFRKNKNYYSNTVYVIGNSYHHLPTLHELNRNPGCVWLHDICLHGLAWDFAQISSENPWDFMSNMLKVYDASIGNVTSFDDLRNCGFQMARPLLQNASSFVVHSEHARRLLKFDLGENVDKRPIYVVPHAITQEFDHVLPEADGGGTMSEKNRIRIGTLGFMAPIRAPEIIIEGLSKISNKGKKIDFIIAGACDPGYKEKLKSVGMKAGINVEFTGYLSENEFLSVIRTFDAVVQIRKSTNGESSGTVAMAIAAGIPVVTNIQSAIEYWGDVIVSYIGVPSASDIASCVEKSLSINFKNKVIAEKDRIMNEFGIDSICNQLHSIITSSI